MFLAPREYLSFTYFSLQFMQKQIVNTTRYIYIRTQYPRYTQTYKQYMHIYSLLG